jgi:hypothetical protein
MQARAVLREKPQILRLRARPTRTITQRAQRRRSSGTPKSSGSEILCGRFAQDDIFKFRNNAGEEPRRQPYLAQADSFGKVLRVVEKVNQAVAVIDFDLQDAQQLEAENA